MTMAIVRDLTDDEFGEAIGICQRLLKREPCNQFLFSCEGLARGKILTRAQFDSLKRMMSAPVLVETRGRPRFSYGRSKRPITLPGGQQS